MYHYLWKGEQVKIARGLKIARRYFCTRGQKLIKKNFTKGHFCMRLKKYYEKHKKKLKDNFIKDKRKVYRFIT